MKSYFGSYSSSHGAKPLPSSVLIFDKNLNIGFRNPDGTTTTLDWLLKDVAVSFDFSTQATRLKYANSGAEVLIQGNDAAAFVKEMQAEQQKVWYQKTGAKEWIKNLTLLAGLLGLLVLLYLLIVPWLSEKMASKVSINTERQLGDAVYDAMGLAAQEDTTASFVLNKFFAEMDVHTDYRIRITVVNDNVVNAFALPGGRIVVYTALLKQIKSYPELAALLSHEFTHINNKHSTKSIFRKLGSKVFLGLLFGSFGSVTSVLVNHADNLKSLTYSRKLEKEADTEGLAILTQRKIDPQGFVSLFNHLKESAQSDVLPEFLGSHPDTDKRIAYINEASKGAPINDNNQLKTIFSTLNFNQW
jgi:Zn-dependent protease with chaperone function